MAVSYIGASNLIATNGGAPGAITPNASTQVGDLMIFFHYSRATGGNETVTVPTGFTQVFNSLLANSGLLAIAYRFEQITDTTFTSTITNHTSGTSGETVLQWIETYRGVDTSNPIPAIAARSNWASSLNLGPISAPASPAVAVGNMVVVVAGRFENITAQTTLSGDGLTWTARTRNDSTLGSDAAAVTQNGLNATAGSVNVTAKTITTTGTAQTGIGTMFILQEEQSKNITETANATDTVSGSLGYPEVLSTTTGTTSGTSHSITLPATVLEGEVLVAIVGIDGSNLYGSTGVRPPIGWYYLRNLISSSTTSQFTFYKIANGSEGGTSVTLTTSVSEGLSYVVLRVTKSILLDGSFAVGDSANSTFNIGPSNGNVTGKYLFVSFRSGDADIQVTAPSTNYTFLNSVTGPSTGASVYVQYRELNLTTANSSDTPSAVTVATEQWITGVIAFKSYPDGSNIFTKSYWPIPYGDQLYLSSYDLLADSSYDISGTTSAPDDAVAYKIVGNNGRLTEVWFLYATLWRSSRLVIWEDDSNGNPSNNILAQSSVLSGTVNLYSSQLAKFTLTTPLILLNGKVYYIGVQASSGIAQSSLRFVDASIDWGGSTLVTNTRVRNRINQTWSSTNSSFQIISIPFIDEIVDVKSVTESATATDTTDGSVAGAIIASISEATSATDTVAVAQRVTKFELWNATTNVYVRDLINNDIIAIGTDVATLSAVAIRARTDPDDAVGSVRLVLSGSSSQARTENTPPYFLYGDNSGDPDPWLGNAGSHSLIGTPWTLSGASGAQGVSLTISFVIAYSASISESGSGNDNQSSSLTANVTNSESATASDSITSTGSFSLIISESVTSTDSISANRSSNVSISESTSATESQASNFVSSVTISESTNANDSITVALSSSKSINESTTANDSINVVALYLRSISEAVTANDSQSSNVNFTSSINEIANAIDSITATTTGNQVTISESGNAFDLISSSLIRNVQISEASNAVDSSARNLIINVSLSETANANDFTSVSLSGVVLISENVSATDSINKSAIRVASISETSSANDSILGAISFSKIINESAVAIDSYSASVSFGVNFLRNSKITTSFITGSSSVELKNGSIIKTFMTGKVDSGIQKTKTTTKINSGTIQTRTGI